MKPKNEETNTPLVFSSIPNEQQAQDFYDALINQKAEGDIRINDGFVFRPGDTTAYPTAFAFNKKESSLAITFNIYGQDMIYKFYKVKQAVVSAGNLRMQADELEIIVNNVSEGNYKKLKFELGQ